MATSTDLVQRVTSLEHEIKSKASTESVSEITYSIRSLTAKLDGLVDDVQGLFAAHDQILKERAEQERQLHEQKMAALAAEAAREKAAMEAEQAREREALKAKTLPEVCKRVGALAGILITLITAAGLVVAGFKWWVLHYVITTATQ